MVRGYEVVVELLSRRLGGGFVAYAPALTGCAADGATSDEALENVADAIDCWIAYAKQSGRRIPEPAVNETTEEQASPAV
ncbi:MAG TPA: type II toxin-antitoxin system HicB family antitoxin [Sphingomicrobium sp.]|nr:type II toxin-antitoxin system HicB family antitoxin [Sphingomicrobium sp.]